VHCERAGEALLLGADPIPIFPPFPHRSEERAMAQRMDVRVGMDVKSKDGHRLGKVIGLAADAFVVEKGIFYAKDYRVPFSSVSTIEGDDIRLSLDKDQLHKASLGEVLDAADRLNMAPDSLSEARMDSAKFQDHDQYNVGSNDDKDVEPSRPIGFDPNAPTHY
jgi:hypothetical protein